MVLLTSSQVSVIITSIIIFSLTSALFISGYVAQQHTLSNLRAAIRPPPKPLHTDLYQPPSPPPEPADSLPIYNHRSHIPGLSDDEASWSARRRAEAEAAISKPQETPLPPPPPPPPPPLPPQQEQQATPSLLTTVLRAFTRTSHGSAAADAEFSLLDEVGTEQLSRAARRRLFRAEIERAAAAKRPKRNPFVYKKRIDD